MAKGRNDNQVIYSGPDDKSMLFPLQSRDIKSDLLICLSGIHFIL